MELRRHQRDAVGVSLKVALYACCFHISPRVSRYRFTHCCSLGLLSMFLARLHLVQEISSELAIRAWSTSPHLRRHRWARRSPFSGVVAHGLSRLTKPVCSSAATSTRPATLGFASSPRVLKTCGDRAVPGLAAVARPGCRVRLFFSELIVISGASRRANT